MSNIELFLPIFFSSAHPSTSAQRIEWCNSDMYEITLYVRIECVNCISDHGSFLHAF